MKLSSEGRKFIQHFEGCTLKAYPDGKFYSIGYGHNGPDVTKDMKITKARADELFSEDIVRFEDAVNRGVRVPLSQSEFDALVSLAYNIGVQGFLDSRLALSLNMNQVNPDLFLPWNKFEGKVNGNLVKRRAAEKSLFLGFDVKTAIKAGDEAYALYRQGLQGS